MKVSDSCRILSASFKRFSALIFQTSEPEKNREDPSDGAAGAKKRRRRKRNTDGEGATGVQV